MRRALEAMNFDDARPVRVAFDSPMKSSLRRDLRSSNLRN